METDDGVSGERWLEPELVGVGGEEQDGCMRRGRNVRRPVPELYGELGCYGAMPGTHGEC